MDTEARNITILQECPDLNALLRAWKCIPEAERTSRVRECYYTTRDAAMLGWRRDHPNAAAPVFKQVVEQQPVPDGAERRAIEEYVATLAEHVAMGSLTNEQAQERCQHIISRRGANGTATATDLAPAREYHATLRAAARRGVDGLAGEALRIAREIRANVEQGRMLHVMAQRSAHGEASRLMRAGASRGDVLHLTILADALGQEYRAQEDERRQQEAERQRRVDEERQANRLSAVVRITEALAGLEQDIAQGSVSRGDAQAQYLGLRDQARSFRVAGDSRVLEAARSAKAAIDRIGYTLTPKAGPRTEVKPIPTTTRRIIV